MKNFDLKRKLAFLLAFMLIITIMPMNVLADGQKTKTIFFTMSNAGEFALQEDGKTAMVRIPIEVPDDALLHDAMVKAHIDYCKEGEDGIISAGGFYNKIWGVETPFIGYALNGEITSEPANQVGINHGDEVDAFIYADYRTDKYAKFDSSYLEVQTGENIHLKLTGVGVYETKDVPIEGATLLIGTGGTRIPCDDSNSFTTDSRGDITFAFPNAGEYFISAKMPKGSPIGISAPICHVVVTGEDLSKGDLAEKAQADADAIELSGITDNEVDSEIERIQLPKLGDVNNSKISWISSDPTVITNEGGIIRKASEESVTLTAKVSYWGEEVTRDFTLKVSPVNEDTIEEILNEIAKEFTEAKLNPLEFTGEAYGGYYSKLNSLPMDINLLTKAQAIADSRKLGCTVELIHEHPAIGQDGHIYYGDAAVTAEVTFKIEMMNVSRLVKLSIKVPAHATTKEEALSGDWLDFDTIRSENISMDLVKTNIVLPDKDPYSLYTEVQWTSSNEDIIEISSYATNSKFTGKVIRPHLGNEPEEVTLTARIKPGLYWDYDMAPAGPMPDTAYTEKKFVLTVVPVSEDEKGAAQLLVDEGIRLFDLEDITLRGTTKKADINGLTYSINGIPMNWNYVEKAEGFRSEYRVIDVAWTSENPGIGNVSSGADITRTNEDQTGDIVLTLSYNGAQAVKRFPAVVKAFTEEDARLENAILQEVSDSLTFDIIKASNMRRDEITSDLVAKKSAVKDGETIRFENGTNYHNDGANITWSSDNESVITGALKVRRPAENTVVNLKATLTSPRFSNQPEVLAVEKTFSFTVLGTGEKTLTENIADYYNDKDVQWWASNANWWHAAAIGAFRDAYNKQFSIDKDNEQAFVDKSIKSIAELNLIKANATGNSNVLANAINGLSALNYDPENLWTVNRTKIDAVKLLNEIDIVDAQKGFYSTIAPYVIAAYNQGDYDTKDLGENHIAYLADELSNTNWEWGVDIPAMILHGLNMYYDIEDVRQKIDNAIVMLSGLQGEAGSYGSSNSDATVIIALSQLGINVDTDPRFIKNGNSLLDGLLSYKVDENNGFTFDDESKEFNDMSTVQGFIALISAREVMSTGKPYNPFDFSMGEKIPAYAIGAKDDEPLPPPSGEKDIKVYVTVKADNKTWISRTSATLKEGATAYHGISDVLEKKNFEFESVGNNYISSVTNSSGTTLAEYSQGEYSGWMYRVNGESPKVGLKDYKLSDKDEILLYFTKDWTVDSDFGSDIQGSGETAEKNVDNNSTVSKIEAEAKTDSKGNASIIIKEKDVIDAIENVKKQTEQAENKEAKKEVQVVIKADSKATSINATFSKEAVTKLGEAVDIFSVMTPFADIRLDSKTLMGIAKTNEREISISVAKVNGLAGKEFSDETRKSIEESIGNRPAFDFAISVGAEKISKFSGRVSVSIPYTPLSTEDTNKIIMFYVHESGELEGLRYSRFNEKTKMVDFDVDHFSKYAVGYKEINFKDITNHWAKDNIIFLGAREIMNGRTAETFDPVSNITRAEFAQLLANISGADLNGYTESNFSDVQTNMWYTKAIAWAKEAGVVSGIKQSDGSVKFRPNDPISRQDMSVMLWGYIDNVEKKSLKGNVKRIVFADDSEISSYAMKSVQELQQAGIINGVKNKDGSFNFNPKKETTRGETATMIANFIRIENN